MPDRADLERLVRETHDVREDSQEARNDFRTVAARRREEATFLAGRSRLMIDESRRTLAAINCGRGPSSKESQATWSQSPTAQTASTHSRILCAVRRLTQSIDRWSNVLLKEVGLTGPQLGVLKELAERALSPSEIATRLRVGPPTIAGVLARLQKRGLVCRARDPVDLRHHIISLTEIGRTVTLGTPSILGPDFEAKLAAMDTGCQCRVASALEELADMLDCEPCDE